MKKNILVVGGGPAGMMAAIRASQLGASVTLLERNQSLGRKLLLTGKGRCNLTNAGELDDILQAFSRQGQFLRDAFKVFFNKDLVAFFEKRGLAMKTERQFRIFPVTDRSASVLQVLKEDLLRCGVNVMTGVRVQRIKCGGGRVSGIGLAGGREIDGDAVVLATGGLSFAFTGSSGDGLKMAEQTGHRIVSCRPGLVPLVTVETFPKQLRGLTLKNIRLEFKAGRHQVTSEIGELLFTDFGVSGPLILSLSGTIGDWLAAGQTVSMAVDIKPALSEEQLESRLLRDVTSQPKRQIVNLLKEYLPISFIPVFLKIAKVPEKREANQLRQADRRQLIKLFKAFPLRIKATLPLEEAMVTKGGVSLKDIDPRTMASRKLDGLYFAGELMDVDGDTGGYNLQAAFSTGYLAGQSAAGE